MALNFEKLKAAIHYICEKASKDPTKLDEIKLNKVLWYSDAQAYLTRGVSITGATYIKKPFGPVAKYNRSALGELESAGAIHPGKSAPDGSRSSRWQRCFDVCFEADKSPFDGVELKIMDDVFKRVCLENDSFTISEQSHGKIWTLAQNGEELPLYTVFAEDLGVVTDEHIRAASADLG